MGIIHCRWCKRSIQESYVVLWRVIDGRKRNISFLHLTCEEDFVERSGKIGWQELFVEEAPVVYCDPRFASR